MNSYRKRHKFQFIVISLVFGMGLFYCGRRTENEEIIARVENAVLTRKDLMDRIDLETVRPDQEKEFVEKWVDRELLYREAKRLGLDKSKELEWELELVEKEYAIQKLLERIYAKKIQITEEEIVAYYEQNQDLFLVDEDEVRILHILTEKRSEARVELQEIQAGKEFGEVARERSIGLFKEKGGSLGYIKREDVIPEIARIAFHLEPGKVSSIIHSGHGYHIIKVVKKRSKGDVKALSEVRDEILQRLRVIKERSVYYDLLFQLQNEAKVYIAIPQNEEESSTNSVNEPDYQESEELGD